MEYAIVRLMLVLFMLALAVMEHTAGTVVVAALFLDLKEYPRVWAARGREGAPITKPIVSNQTHEGNKL